MELILLDDDLNISYTPIEDFYSLQWIDEWEKAGSFALSISSDYYTPMRNAQYLYNNDSDSTGLIEQVTYNELSGKKTMSVKGHDINVLFDDVVIPVTYYLQGNLEEKIRALVSTYAINGNQKINKLQLGNLVGYEETVYTQVTGLSLSEALYKLLSPYGMSWKLHYSYLEDIIYFDILKGKNRTQDQTDNNWAVFSSSFENIKNKQLLYSEAEYKNFAYVAGAGEGVNRTIIEVDRTNGEKRRSIYVDAKDLQPEEGNDVDKFFICGSSGNIRSSVTGTGWTAETSGTTNGLQRPSYNDGVYFACGRNGTILTSDGSGTWTVQQSGTSQNLQGSLYHEGLYLVVGANQTILVSTNGINWVNRSLSGSNAIYSVVRGANAYYACGENGYIYKSTNGYDWTYQQIASNTLYMMVYEECRYIAVGIGGIVYVSDDGEAWTQKQSNTTQNLTNISYGSGVFIVSGAAGTIIRSTNRGETWGTRTSGLTFELYASAYGNGHFIIIGFSGDVMLRSVDGLVWQQVSISLGFTPWGATFGTSYYKHQLKQRGIEKLSGYKLVDEITCDVDNNVIPKYGDDYLIGDICDIVIDDLSLEYSERVVTVTRVYEPQAITITPTFGTKYLTINEYISREAKS